MTTPTYDLIETTTLTSAASSVTFSSITQDYRDLVLVAEAKGDGGNAVIRVQFNSDTGSNYYNVLMGGDGSSENSSTASAADNIGSDSGTTTDAVLVIHQIQDYSATDKHKTVLTRTAKPSNVRAFAQRWAVTSAISSLEVYPFSNQMASGSTFSLYGIAS